MIGAEYSFETLGENNNRTKDTVSFEVHSLRPFDRHTISSIISKAVYRRVFSLLLCNKNNATSFPFTELRQYKLTPAFIYRHTMIYYFTAENIEIKI